MQQNYPYPERITVVIPPEEFSDFTYLGAGRCYLEKALDNAGYTGSRVGGFGETQFFGNSPVYKPEQRFNADIVRNKMKRNKSITVTLVIKLVNNARQKL